EGDPRTAAATFARSADIALATGEIRFAAYALANAVDSFLRMEAVDEAASSAERALALATTIGDPLAVSTARANMGLVFAKRGDSPSPGVGWSRPVPPGGRRKIRRPKC